MKKLNSLTAFWRKRLQPFIKDPFMLSKWVSEYPNRRDPGRITVWVNGGYKTLRDDYQGELFMFLQDMHLGIMPFKHRRGSTYSAKLVPADADLEKTIAEAISHSGFKPRLSEAVNDFIEQTSQSLFYHSEVFFELYCETDDQGNITKIEFYHIYQPSMRKVFGQYFQIIPWSAAKHARIKAGIRRVPKEKILHIKVPSEFGGTYRWNRILKRLGKLSRTSIPEFQMKAFETNKGIGFDFDRYRKEKYIEIAQLTKKTGWGQRQQRDNEILEYYTMHRHLTYARMQAKIREHVLARLNEALEGKIISSNSSIEVEGLLTADEVDEEFKKLQAGDLKFADVYSRTSRV
ncbi:MAG: hypothetical protein JNK33_01025 [Candidatus Doudnabacteria bacterium]|nr:hypothetical protein [Candidatus Doudnabacteria bacterium]